MECMLLSVKLYYMNIIWIFHRFRAYPFYFLFHFHDNQYVSFWDDNHEQFMYRDKHDHPIMFLFLVYTNAIQHSVSWWTLCRSAPGLSKYLLSGMDIAIEHWYMYIWYCLFR